MSRLTIFADHAPEVPVLQTDVPSEIATELARIGVNFRRWESPVPVDGDAAPETILEAYKPYLDELMGEVGAGSADVVKLTPDNPAVPTLRAKFLNEHIHTEPEIRFFVDGSGHFVMHVDGKVYDAHCNKGDLIFVPANVKHWFDAGEKPSFTALRVFSDTAGWVAHFTGDDISSRFTLS